MTAISSSVPGPKSSVEQTLQQSSEGSILIGPARVISVANTAYYGPPMSDYGLAGLDAFTGRRGLGM